MGPNPKRASDGWPPAMVAGGFLTGVVLMRNLARRGVKVSCVDWIPTQPAFKTVYGQAHLCPNPDTHPDEWVQFMIGLAGDGPKPVLIPSADQYVTAIADHADALETHFTFCRGSAATQALLATKKRQYEIAGDHGLPVPRTAFIRSLEELREFARTAQFPCLLKPTHFREWERFPTDHPLYGKKTATAKAPEELEAQYGLARQVSAEMVVQEIIEGPDTAKLCYLSCYAISGERLGSCMVRQIRTTPVYFGSASIVEPIDDPETDRACDEFLRSVGYAGLCEIELKRDQRDGQVKMIEANPRYSVTSDAAPYAGVDLGWLHYLNLIGQKVTPVNPTNLRFRHIFLMRDFATYRDCLKEGLVTWWDLIYSYRPPVHFFDFDLRDWRVTAQTMDTLARTLFYPLFRSLFPKR